LNNSQDITNARG